MNHTVHPLLKKVEKTDICAEWEPAILQHTAVFYYMPSIKDVMIWYIMTAVKILAVTATESSC